MSNEFFVRRRCPGAACRAIAGRFEVRDAFGAFLGSGLTPAAAWEDTLEALEANDLRAVAKML